MYILIGYNYYSSMSDMITGKVALWVSITSAKKCIYEERCPDFTSRKLF